MDRNDCNNDEPTRDEQYRTIDHEGHLSTDSMLELLAHPYRRGLIQYFADESGDVSTVEEVTTHLIARERERTDDRLDRERVEIALVHVHLPKLAAAGIIEHDLRSREIRYRRRDRLEALLEALPE